MAARFSALLIGVTHYADRDIPDLPFIASDLAELERALHGAGYDAVTVHDPRDTGRDGVLTAIEGFVVGARRGETLLVYLSGHGMHSAGVDYLIPSGAQFWMQDLPSRCVAVDVERFVEASECGDVVVFVDACREGIHVSGKAAPQNSGWSEGRHGDGGKGAGAEPPEPWSAGRAARASRRSVVYVYGCASGQRARYTDDADGRFSVLSRALRLVLDDPAGPAHLMPVVDALQSRVDELMSGMATHQEVRPRGDQRGEGPAVRPRPAGIRPTVDGLHPWALAVREHSAWELAAAPGGRPGRELERVRDAATELAAALATRWEADARRLGADRWHDEELAERVSSHLERLVSWIAADPAELALDPAEAVVLAVGPFLETAFWTAAVADLAAEVDPTDLAPHPGAGPERAAFERFCRGYSRLRRRAERSDPRAAADIGWWLLHRYTAQRRETYDRDRVAALVGSPASPLLRHALDPARVLEYLRAPRVDAGSLARSDRRTALAPTRGLPGTLTRDHRVREQMLGYLLVAANRMALDPTTMPEVVVEHLGIRYSVDVPALHRTLRSATWEARGRSRVLSAACDHPAVDLALQQQAAATDALLRDVHLAVATGSAALAPLGALPDRATADEVGAAERDGHTGYQRTDLRFRLADDRIQELLMGQELYGDPALAIRELYQNALDACRYRQARTTYLRRTGERPPPWRGGIEFFTGEDELGTFLACRDNGIGMGERELTQVFCRAGVRFDDLPEFIEEQAAWSEVGVALHPISRFGIGVLSYFMIADDITVETCRLDRKGRPRDRLRITISGPGALFTVEPLGPGADAGTTVTLHLRPEHAGVSCTDLLRRVLWAPDYDVSAVDHHGPLELTAGALSGDAPVGADDPRSAAAERGVTAVDPAPGGAVWWCDGPGGVLADGLWVGIPLWGAVVNLTGPDVPELTVDRNRVLRHDDDAVSRLLAGAVDALVQPGGEVLGHDWLSRLSAVRPALADEVCRRAVELDLRPWTVADRKVPLARVGCFPVDADLFRAPGEDGGYVSLPPEPVLAQRLRTWTAAGIFPGVTTAAAERPAVPSDEIILCEDPDRSETYGSGYLDASTPVPPGHVARAAEVTGRAPADLAARLRELGLAVGPVPDALDDPRDIVLLSTDGQGDAPWLPAGAPVLPFQLAWLAYETGRPPEEVRARLARWGLPVRGGTVPGPDDLRLASTGTREAGPPWLDPDEPVSLRQVARASAATGRPPREVAARLRAWDYATPDPDALPASFDARDADLLDVVHRPEPFGTAPSVVDLVRASVNLELALPDVVERARSWGCPCPDVHDLPPRPDQVDLVLLSRDLDGIAPWLEQGRAVDTPHVSKAAEKTGIPAADVVDRLRTWGLLVPDLPDVERLDVDERVVLSRDLDGSAPWLEPDRPVDVVHVARAAQAVSWSPARVVDLLTGIGYAVHPAGADLPAELDPDDLLLLGADGGPSRLDPRRPVPIGHVLLVADRLRLPFPEVVDRLRRWGLDVSGVPPAVGEVAPDDVVLLSAGGDGSGPWLEPGARVTRLHVAQCSLRTRTGPRRVAERLAAWGLLGPAPEDVPDTHDPLDPTWMSRPPWSPGLGLGGSDGEDGEDGQDGEPDRPDTDASRAATALLRLANTAAQARRSPRALAERLRAWNLTAPDPDTVPPTLDPDDPTFLSRHLGGTGRGLEPGSTVERGHVVRAAARAGRPPHDVAARLAAWGFGVPDRTALPAALEPDDVLLLSRDLDGRDPWLDPAEPVPAGILVALLRKGHDLAHALDRFAVLGMRVEHVRRAG